MLGDPASPLFWKSGGDRPDERSLPVWCAYTGQNEEAALDWGWLDALHPAHRQAAQNTWKQALLTPHPFTLYCQIRHFRQGYRSFRILCTPVFDAKCRTQHWLIFFTEEPDIPPLIDEPWEIRLMLSMLFTQTTLGIFYLSLDGALLRVNERFCQLLGYSEAELLKM